MSQTLNGVDQIMTSMGECPFCECPCLFHFVEEANGWYAAECGECGCTKLRDSIQSILQKQDQS